MENENMSIISNQPSNAKLKAGLRVITLAAAALLAVAGPIGCSKSKPADDSTAQAQASPTPDTASPAPVATPVPAASPAPKTTSGPVAAATPNPVHTPIASFPPTHILVSPNLCLLSEDFAQARKSSVRARVAAGIPSSHLDAEGALKAFGAGDSEVLEGTLAESFSSGGGNRNTSLQLTITPRAMVTIERLDGGKPRPGSHAYTIQGTCTGHSITGVIEKISQVSIQLSH
jgi:hypothetical protein